ncbi:MAG: hypothetical protein L6R41_008134 [Letrouitia leprolyta]|nr:MAG: hypothetical protein L6R41_008134 [Letrouitia leprolyta]
MAKSEYNPYGPDWKSWALAAQVHYSLLENIEKNQLHLYHYGTSSPTATEGVWDMAFGRMNINFMAIWGKDVLDNAPFDGPDDEHELSVGIPVKVNRPVLVNTHAVAAHFSFRTQHELYETDLLDRYRAYANEMNSQISDDHEGQGLVPPNFCHHKWQPNLGDANKQDDEVRDWCRLTSPIFVVSTCDGPDSKQYAVHQDILKQSTVLAPMCEDVAAPDDWLAVADIIYAATPSSDVVYPKFLRSLVAHFMKTEEPKRSGCTDAWRKALEKGGKLAVDIYEGSRVYSARREANYSDISEKGLFGPELYREDIVIDGKTWKEDYDLGGELE